MSTTNIVNGELPPPEEPDPVTSPAQAPEGAAVIPLASDDDKPLEHGPKASSNLSLRKRKQIFAIMSLLECFANYDTGAMAIMLNWIEEPYDFSTSDLGVMGALPYLGLIILSPFIGAIFTYYRARWFIAIGLILNVLSLVVFFLSVNKYMFFVSRFLVGATQAIFIIYGPVWVGCFAPAENKNMWMAILQGSVAFGFMLGYGITAIFKVAGERGWRYSIGTQAIILGIFIYLFAMAPEEYINVPIHDEERRSSGMATDGESVDPSSVGGTTEPPDDSVSRIRHKYSVCSVSSRISNLSYARNCSFFDRIASDLSIMPALRDNRNYYEWAGTNTALVEEEEVDTEDTPKPTLKNCLCLIVRNPYFCFSTIAVSVLFYILTAIQFWTTKTSLKIFHVPESVIYSIFIFTSITAPMSGVALGSWLIDLLNRKYPTKPIIIDIVIVSWAFITLLCSMSAVLFQNFYNLVICIWLILLFGGCMLPPLTLITIGQIPDRLKPMASGICMCIYHIVGYIGGTVMPGIIADVTDSDAAVLYATYLPAILGVVASMGNVISRHRENRRAKKETEIVVV